MLVYYVSITPNWYKFSFNKNIVVVLAALIYFACQMWYKGMGIFFIPSKLLNFPNHWSIMAELPPSKLVQICIRHGYLCSGLIRLSKVVNRNMFHSIQISKLSYLDVGLLWPNYPQLGQICILQGNSRCASSSDLCFLDNVVYRNIFI